jgi:hypothetical protein
MPFGSPVAANPESQSPADRKETGFVTGMQHARDQSEEEEATVHERNKVENQGQSRQPRA